MRVLAIFSFSFAVAVFSANYFLEEELLLALGGGLALVCAAAVFFSRRRPGAAKRVALAAAGLSVGLCWTAAYTHVFYQPARELDDRTVRLTGVAADWPQETEYGYSLLIHADTGDGITIPTLLYVDEQGAQVRPGDMIQTIVHCTLAERSAAGEEITYYTAKGIFLWGRAYGLLEVDRPQRVPLRYAPAMLSRQLKEGVAASFQEDVEPLIQALVTGNREKLTDTFTSSLERTGLSHTVAVSGMHVAFLASLLGMLLGNGRRRTALVLIPTVLLFMMIAGNTPSVVRASVMILLLYIAPLFDRERDDPTALGFALLLILAQNPFSAAHVGLQLSFSAVAGILLCSERLCHWLEGKAKLKKGKKWSLRWVWNKGVYFCITTLSATVGAMALTTPLVAIYFESLSLISPLSNLLTLWAVSLAFMGGLIAGVAGAIAPAAGQIVALSVIPLAQYLNWIVPLLSKAPFAAVTMDSFYYRAWLVFAYGLLLLTVMKKGKKRLAAPALSGGLTLAVSVALTMLTFWSGRMTVAVLDVGQGQSVLLRVGDSLTLVDCGGDRWEGAGNVAADYIQGVGRRSIQLLVISHFHDDHAGGVPELLERIDVEAIALPEGEEDSSLKQEILTVAREQDVPVYTIKSDETFTWESGQLTIFPPLGAGEINEAGLTVLAQAEEFDVLITGDMGGDIEEKLLVHTRLPDVELLVAGHHGAQDSTSQALLDAVRPELAVISVGENNPYGHPAQETLERLAAAGGEIYRTDLHGTVRVNTEEAELKK